MQPYENNSESNEQLGTHFGRRLDIQNRLKDRLIIQHLRRQKNNFLSDFDENLDRASFLREAKDA